MKACLKKVLASAAALALTIAQPVYAEGDTVSNAEEAAVSYEEDAADSNAEDAVGYDDTAVIYAPDMTIKENLPSEKPSAAEDYYLYVNYDAISEMTLPEGKSNYGTFVENRDNTEQQMIELLEGDAGEDTLLASVSSLYHQYMDTESRDAAGWDSVKAYTEKINSLESIDDYVELLCSDMYYLTYSLPFSYSVYADEKNSTQNILSLYPVGLLLEDSDEYREMTEMGELYKEADDTFIRQLLVKYGFAEEEADDLIEKQYQWESMLADYIYPVSTSYRADYTSLVYNPYSYDELIELAGDFPIDTFLEAIGLERQEKYVVTEPEYFSHLGALVTEENLQLIKADLLISTLIIASQYTDTESYGYYNDWVNTKQGSTGMSALDSLAYQTVNSLIPEAVGDVYANHYFSAEAREDIEKIVDELIEALRGRLEKADWMSDGTREKALEKLDAIGVYIGYADTDYYDYSKIMVDSENDLYTNVIGINVELNRQSLEKAGEAVDREAWGIVMSANTVNACYIPSMNCICFPAAILQGAFYDESASIASKMGSIGAVIGHELTHAFDTTGSQYDKDGNLENWWTDEDLEAFTALTAKVGERYGSYATVGDTRVNGDLTIGETVADLGGAAAALDVLKKHESEGENIDYQDFFEANVHLWAGIETRNRALNLLKTDPHAPMYLRVNVNLTQFDEFYETYDVEEGDAMYTAPEARLSVW